jgi:hypothetical protein
VATIVKRVDRGVESNKRYQYWQSGDPGDAWDEGDIIDVQATLGRPARYIFIETGANCDLKIRLNSQIRHVPMRDPIVNDPIRPSIEDEEFVTDSSMNAIALDSSDTWEMKDVIPVTDIELASWTDGPFEIIIA